jgi:hypothetical protein
MPMLNADALNTDLQGIEFLRDVLGTEAEASAPGRRFPLEAWTPKRPAAGLSDEKGLLSGSEVIQDRVVEAVL